MQTFKKKWLIRILLAGLGATIAILFLLVGLFLFVRTETGGKAALSVLQNKVMPLLDAKLTYKSAHFDLFSGFTFQQLELSKDGADSNLIFSVEKLVLEYKVLINERKLVFENIFLDRPRVLINRKIHSQNDQVSQPNKASPFDQSVIQEIARFLKNPFVSVEVKKIKIINLFVDYIAKGLNQEQRFKIHQINLDSTFSLVPGGLNTSGSLANHSPMEISHLEKNEKGEKSASLNLGMKVQWSISVLSSGTNWTYNINSTQVGLDFSKVNFSNKSTGLGKTQEAHEASSQRIQIEKILADAEIDIQATTFELFEPKLKSFQTKKLELNLKSGSSVLVEKTAANEHKLSWANQEFRVSSDPKNSNSELKLYSEIKRLFLTNELTRPLDFLFSGRIGLAVANNESSEPAGFVKPKLNYQYTGSLLTSKLIGKIFDVKGDLQFGKDEISTNNSISIKLDSDLAGAFQSLKSFIKENKNFFPATVESSLNGKLIASEKLSFTYRVDIPDLKTPELKAPLDLQLAGSGEGQLSLGKLTLLNELTLNQIELGEWSAKSKIDLNGSAAELSSVGSTEVTNIKRAEKKTFPLELTQPIRVSHQIMLGLNREKNTRAAEDFATFEILIPEVKLAQRLVLTGNAISGTLKSGDIRSAKDVDITVSGKQKKVVLTALNQNDARTTSNLKSEELLEILENQFSLKARIANKTQLVLEDFSANFMNGMLAVSAQGSGNSLTRDFQLQANSILAIKDKIAFAGQKIRGDIEVPIKVSINQGKEFDLNGHFGIRDFSWEMDPFSISGVNGRFPISEKLVLKKKGIGFEHLISQNPFERVDFEKVRPMLDGTEVLRIGKMTWENRTYGPMVGFFSLQQNMFSAHQFDLDLGKGRVYGEMYFDTYPSNLQFGVLSRLTGLNLSEVLPSRFLLRMPAGDKFLSARSGLVLNLNRGVLNGRIDVTEIGGPQMVAFANVLDPNYENEKLNKLRTLLNIGYPTAVAMSFKEGFMNMDVDLNLLNVHQRHSLRELPISRLISKTASDVVKEAEKGPIQ